MTNPAQLWVQFVGVILALSGVEAIANLTGVMKLDPDSTPERSESRARSGEGDFAGRRSKWSSAQLCSAGQCFR